MDTEPDAAAQAPSSSEETGEVEEKASNRGGGAMAIVPATVSSSERRYGEGQSFNYYLAEQMKDPEFRAAYEQISAEEDAKFATTGAAEGGQQLTEVAATATADEEDSTTTPNNAVREDLKALVQLLVEDVSEYFLDTDPKVDFTRLPNIIRMRLSRHFPPIEAAQPAGVEGGAVAWLLPQIKRRLQTVLDCENGMCTHCCEVLAGDLAPMIDRAIELCATPAPAEGEEARL
jgi:hypothetical protein